MMTETTTTALLTKLKLRTKAGDDRDDYLQALLDEAKAQVLDYTNRDEITERMEVWMVALAINKYNQEGVEGVTERSEGGVSEKYDNGMPAYIATGLNKYRRSIGRHL